MWHLAQLNIGRAKGPMDGPVMAGFAALLDPVNALADAAPGFVWRLQDDSGNATSIRAFDDDSLMLNMSVWESVEALRAFVYTTAHVDALRRRAEWFEKFDSVYVVAWWIPAGHIPSIEEAKERLDHLEAHGPTPYAFTLRQPFAPDDASDAAGMLPA